MGQTGDRYTSGQESRITRGQDNKCVFFYLHCLQLFYTTSYSQLDLSCRSCSSSTNTHVTRSDNVARPQQYNTNPPALSFHSIPSSSSQLYTNSTSSKHCVHLRDSMRVSPKAQTLQAFYQKNAAAQGKEKKENGKIYSTMKNVYAEQWTVMRLCFIMRGLS